jgi:predicted nucleic-acid-binding Zn-ribbon protein
MSWFKNEATSVKISGIVLKCKHCTHDEFYRDKRMLNSGVATFLGFDWLNKSAIVYTCSNCGFIHWFMPR